MPLNSKRLGAYTSLEIIEVPDEKTPDKASEAINLQIKEKEGNARISVYNSGAHIPEEDIDRIWDKFYKVDKARTREYGGSGVGLSIVKAIMNIHGKNYGVSNVDGGVEFYIELDAKSI